MEDRQDRAAELQEILDMKIPDEDEGEFMTLFTDLAAKLNLVPLKSREGMAYNAKLMQMLRFVQVLNPEKYDRLLPLYRTAEESSRKKSRIRAWMEGRREGSLSGVCRRLSGLFGKE